MNSLEAYPAYFCNKRRGDKLSTGAEDSGHNNKPVIPAKAGIFIFRLLALEDPGFRRDDGVDFI
jgi:hypothetical protein